MVGLSLRLPFATRSPFLRWIARALLLVLVTTCVLVIAEAVRVFGLDNHHTVLVGQVYRCAQLRPRQLRELIQTHGIRTVVNLRGISPGTDWYDAEARLTHELDINQEDITLSAYRLPPRGELLRLIDVLDHAEGPLLIHCKQGADRTGLASAIAVLMFTTESLAEARKQLWPSRGHFRFGRTAAMDQFFDLYEAWLTREQQPHSPERFRHWAAYVYTPGVAKSELRWLDPVPVTLKVGQPLRLRLEAINRSIEPWSFQPGNYSGIHLGYRLASPQRLETFTGQSGLFRRSVSPGQSIVLDVVLPPQRVPGKYLFIAELHDARGASVPIRRSSFVQMGDDSLMAEIHVEE